MMRIELKDIKADIQNTAEAISSALKVDVTIADENLERVAGTGKYTDKIGQRIQPLSAFATAIKERKQFIIENPGENDLCRNCMSRLSCNEFAEVCCPIEMENEIIGVIGLVALDEKQGENIKQNKEELMTFLKKMSDMISSKVKAETKSKELEREKHKMEALFNSIDKAVIATNENGIIEKYNRKFASMFAVDKDIKGTCLKKLLTFLEGNSFRSRGTFFYEKSNVRGVYYISSITFKKDLIGYLFEFVDSSAAVKNFNDMTENAYEFSFSDILGNSEVLEQTRSKAILAAKSSSTLLITGESGTGKELFARAIHNNSDRRDYPFIAVNCGAIPDNLLESELFGYEEGAFTGAKKGGRMGKFEVANKGTIFLDEIGDMSLLLQVKLLRVLQERELERIGSNKKLKLDVRVICATNKNLEEMVLHGLFRRDLFFRLNVIPLHVPPLRDRKEDIHILVKSMIESYNRIMGKGIKDISSDAYHLIMNYAWPGNVRELQNIIEYAINMADSEYITVYDLPEKFRAEKSIGKEIKNQMETSEWKEKGESSLTNEIQISSLIELERKEIEKAIKKFGKYKNDKELICKALGISKATFYRKIKEYGIAQNESDLSH